MAERNCREVFATYDMHQLLLICHRQDLVLIRTYIKQLNDDIIDGYKFCQDICHVANVGEIAF